jgi:excinuclease ABC subunit A
MRVIAASDCVMDIGPGAGEDGGRVVAFGTPEEVGVARESATAAYLRKALGST